MRWRSFKILIWPGLSRERSSYVIYVNSLYWVFFVPALVTYRCIWIAIAGSDFFHFLPAEVTAESPAGFPPSPGFPEASTAKALRWVQTIFCSATCCHVLTCQCFLTQSFPEVLARLCSGFLPRFVFLWLLFRRALCQRRPRRRVGCSGQAVPCLLLRRFQQAVLRRCDWCMLMDVDVCWCM